MCIVPVRGSVVNCACLSISGARKGGGGESTDGNEWEEKKWWVRATREDKSPRITRARFLEERGKAWGRGRGPGRGAGKGGGGGGVGGGGLFFAPSSLCRPHPGGGGGNPPTEMSGRRKNGG